MYYVLRGLFGQTRFDLLYSFVARPENISPISFGIFDLSERSVVLAVLAAGTQFIQARMMQSSKPPKEAGEGGKDESMTAMMNKQMLYFLPLMTLLIGMSFPGGLTLYWFLSTLFMVLQQMWILKKHGTPTHGKSVIEGEVVE